MVLRWAVVAGARRVVVVDPLEARLSYALSGGASSVIGRELGEAASAIAGDSAMPGIIIDTTGNARVFQSLLRMAPQFGRVVLLGDTGLPEEQRLTQDVVLKGLTVVGAHDGHERDGWTGRRVTEFFFDLVASRRFLVDSLITHTFVPRDAPRAYDMIANQREETMGVVFDWTAQDRGNP
jgi:threonine dehydrogenase-like Zn-dependent dehydrogenase